MMVYWFIVTMMGMVIVMTVMRHYIADIMHMAVTPIPSVMKPEETIQEIQEDMVTGAEINSIVNINIGLIIVALILGQCS